MPERQIPPHDSAGAIHVCFAIAADQLANWETHLDKSGVRIEERTRWARSGQSVYFRDLDNHLFELMTPGNWAIY